MKEVINLLRNRVLHYPPLFTLLMAVLLGTASAMADTVSGNVSDDTGEPLIGATVQLKGAHGVAAATDIDGNYTLKVPDAKKGVLVFSYIGMDPKEVAINGQATINLVLTTNTTQLDEVVVVGYGQQKKASIVGAITQASGEVLERAGGVSSVGAALTGNLPGVITTASSGMPGDEDPQIIIRSQSSWNNSSPLVLVDGIEREMSSVDISSVANISVLKDASATAVYGVKGANGVILITTKRGAEGSAKVHAKANMTAKVASKLPEKYDAYDAYMLRNRSIQRDLMAPGAGAWEDVMPMEFISKFRNPLTVEDWDRYPNVDWEDVLFKDAAFSYNASVDVSGGTKFVKYYAAVDFLHEGDLFKSFDGGRGYKTGFGFNRVNVRSNLDFTLTPTTQLTVNLFGSNSRKQTPFGRNVGDSNASFWNSVYRTAPDSFRPIYSDGLYGMYGPSKANVQNSVYALATSGKELITTTKINSDLILGQDLDFITKGLHAQARLSLDYHFVENRRGINDLDNNLPRKWIDPVTGNVSVDPEINSGTGLDPSFGVYWRNSQGEVDLNSTFRKVYYAFQVDYARQFGKHEVTAMGAFNREDYARGSEFHHYREDWVFRTTYNFDSRYFFEFNGAYNGSEKFGSNNRFDFFPSFSLGWRLSEEPFMRNLTWIDQIKFRGSWGRVGDDSAGGRWLYRDQYSYGGNIMMGNLTPSNTPYTIYRLSMLGNPDISWEKVEKRNFGIDYGFLNGLVAGSVDIFGDKRTDIFISGSGRAIPSYFGAEAPGANLGRVDSKGYELELRLNYPINKDTRVWLNASMTHATNEVKYRDDAPMLPAYRKYAGYAINQNKSYVDFGQIRTWDDLYGATNWEVNNANRLPGDYKLLDFNGDGVIDANDNIPYGYSTVPQNTYNATLGFEWKGLSAFVQFYGVTNVSRVVEFPTFDGNTLAYVEGDYWSPTTEGLPLPRWSSDAPDMSKGTRYVYDGSYVRLKNAEISYRIPSVLTRKIGLNSCRVYVNGDNLWLWTKMPDDRESNFSGAGNGKDGAYPTVRRFNVGIDITL